MYEVEHQAGSVGLGLDRDRFASTVAMPLDGGNVSPADFAGKPIPFVPVDIAGGFATRQVTRLRRLLRTGHFDLLHVHGARAALYGRLAAAGLRPRPRVVFSIHGFATPFYRFPKRHVYLAIERALQRVTDRTICVAQRDRKRWDSDDPALVRRIGSGNSFAFGHGRYYTGDPAFLLMACEMSLGRNGSRWPYRWRKFLGAARSGFRPFKGHNKV